MSFEKKCAHCGIIKNYTEYNKASSKKDGLQSHCNECHKKINKEYMQRNKKGVYAIGYKPRSKRSKEEHSIAMASYRQKNKEKIQLYTKSIRDKRKIYMAKYYMENAEEIKKNVKAYNEEHKEHRAKVQKELVKKYLSENIEYKLKTNIRKRVHQSLKYNRITKKEKTIFLLGCSYLFLKKYLETLFSEGMSWENMGMYGWHIDHIIPCAAFDLTDIEQQKKCFNYTNLQPLWAKDNLQKSSKLPDGTNIKRYRVSI